MRTSVACFFVLSVVASAAPVPKAAQGQNIVGTTWSGTDTWSSGEVQSGQISFQPDGKLLYHGDANIPATWTQDGATIRWVINNYSKFEGKLEGDKLTGTGKNNGGQTSTFVLIRQSK